MKRTLIATLAVSAVVVTAAATTAGAALAQNPPRRPPPPQPEQPQQPQPQPQDTTAPMRPMGPGQMGPGQMGPGQMSPGMGRNMQERQRIMQQIQERFAQRVQMELNLTDDLMNRVRAAMRANEDHHRELDRREEDLRRAIGQQLQPGVAANPDSLTRLLDAVAANHVARAQTEQQELRELSFLSPVQRARLLMMRGRLMEQAQEIRQRMRGRMGEGPMQPREPQEP